MDIDMSRRNKVPRSLSDAERARLDEYIDSIHYSARYSDSEYEYRHVQLPKAMLKAIPKDYHDTSKGTLKLLWEEEWRAIGITQEPIIDHYHRVSAGNITRSTSPSPIFCCSKISIHHGRKRFALTLAFRIFYSSWHACCRSSIDDASLDVLGPRIGCVGAPLGVPDICYMATDTKDSGVAAPAWGSLFALTRVHMHLPFIDISTLSTKRHDDSGIAQEPNVVVVPLLRGCHATTN
ncbi:cyclin-dependent kinases regulatory subunit [Metarhizium acridum CQMa 102]|uniref:Cyclin-dependent kinases regulatory subunit n=1 Tax=Metarhizium acridum (strain CQMa 102) TaxID=655827 RepID=E9ECR9_METAQ|nr:cyclin-dependent kinases regulatory subunit [Metarhizium acridum CQMa 102]EFY86286.1 cyclin-dependent kinases regulatory subunit [Metarhizium acridum CQMa 102]